MSVEDINTLVTLVLIVFVVLVAMAGAGGFALGVLRERVRRPAEAVSPGPADWVPFQAPADWVPIEFPGPGPVAEPFESEGAPTGPPKWWRR